MGEPREYAKRRRVQHGRADPGDHVGAERLLLVQHGRHRQRRAGGEVEQGGDDRGGAQVEGDAKQPAGGVARLDVDEDVVDDHSGHLEVGSAQPQAEAAQHGQVDPEFEIVERGQYPLDVGLLVGE